MLVRFSLRGLALALLAVLFLNPAAAQVSVSDAWARATVPGQQGGGVFMTLVAPDGATLIGVSSPVASEASVHEMSLEGGIMRMRPIESLALPAGRSVQLKPGAEHLMLEGLLHPLAAGERIPLTLRFRDAQGRVFMVEVEAEVRKLGAAPGSAAEHTGHGGH